MLLYEVNLEIQKHVFDAFKAWLHEHVKEMLEIPGFIKAKIYESLEVREHTTLLVVHYFLAGPETLQQYLQQHAERMRAKGLQRFGGQFVATRRTLITQEMKT